MFGIKTSLNLLCAKYSWRKKNAHNTTSLGRYVVGDDNVSIGMGSYGPISILSSERNPKVTIGSYCSIADNVTFITGDEHPTNHFSTFPFKVMLLGDSRGEALSKGGIVVEDDVWIGYGATILDGVTIHRGAIVAAGAVVTKDVDPYAVVGGVPARTLRYRFDAAFIQRILQFDYSVVDKEFVTSHLEELYRPLEKSTLDTLLPDKDSN